MHFDTKLKNSGSSKQNGLKEKKIISKKGCQMTSLFCEKQASLDEIESLPPLLLTRVLTRRIEKPRKRPFYGLF